MTIFIVSRTHETLGIPHLVSMLQPLETNKSRSNTIIAVGNDDLHPKKPPSLKRRFYYYQFDPGVALPIFKPNRQEWLVINVGLHDVPVTKRYLNQLAQHLFLSTAGTLQTIVLIVPPPFIPQYLQTSNAIFNALPITSKTAGQVQRLFLEALTENFFARYRIATWLLPLLRRLQRRRSGQ